MTAAPNTQPNGEAPPPPAEPHMNAAGPEMYRPPYKAPVFNHDLSFWNRSYGLKLDAVPGGKIVIFGIPKSGNVWLQSLISDCLGIKGIDPLADIDQSGVGMTHLPFCEAVANRLDFLHGVCLVRDPRSVLTSFYHYSNTEHFRKARLEFHYDSWDEFYYEWFLSRAATAFDILFHSSTYARLGVPVCRYEKVRENPARELRRLLQRWGLPFEEADLAAAVEKNDISTLKKSGKVLNIAVPVTHFRKGGVGDDFRAEIPADILADFELRFAEVLRRWGYAPSSERT